MNSVNIQINGQDNLSPILNNLTQQVYKLRSATSNINVGGGGMNGGGGIASSLFGNLTAANLAAKAIEKGIESIIDLTKKSITAFIELEKTQKTFAFAMGKSGGEIAALAGEIERLRIVAFAKEFGLEAAQITQDFAKFAAAVKGTNINLAEAETIFKGVTKASGALGLSSDQTGRIFKALTDIVSKQTIQSQELVLQLGNNLPGAVVLFARSLGISTKEMRQLMKEGKLTSDMLVNFGKYLDDVYDKAARGNLSTLQGQLNELSNAFTELTQTLGESLGPALMAAVNRLEQVVVTVRDFVESTFGQTIKSEVTKGLAISWESSEQYKNLQNLKGKDLKKYVELQNDQLTKEILNFADESVKEFSAVQITGAERKFDKFSSEATRAAYEDLFYGRGMEGKTASEREAIKKQQRITFGESLLQDLSKVPRVNEQKLNLPFGGNIPLTNALANPTGYLAQQLLGYEPVERGTLPDESKVTGLTKQKALVEMLNKGYYGETDTGAPTKPIETEKLKTDYHTPKIININILTGEGASMINGGVQTTIETSTVDSKDVKDGISNVLNEHLDMILNDTASAVMRIAKSSGMA